MTLTITVTVDDTSLIAAAVEMLDALLTIPYVQQATLHATGYLPDVTRRKPK